MRNFSNLSSPIPTMTLGMSKPISLWHSLTCTVGVFTLYVGRGEGSGESSEKACHLRGTKSIITCYWWLDRRIISNHLTQGATTFLHWATRGFLIFLYVLLLVFISCEAASGTIRSHSHLHHSHPVRTWGFRGKNEARCWSLLSQALNSPNWV